MRFFTPPLSRAALRLLAARLAILLERFRHIATFTPTLPRMLDEVPVGCQRARRSALLLTSRAISRMSDFAMPPWPPPLHYHASRTSAFQHSTLDSDDDFKYIDAYDAQAESDAVSVPAWRSAQLSCTFGDADCATPYMHRHTRLQFRSLSLISTYHAMLFSRPRR